MEEPNTLLTSTEDIYEAIRKLALYQSSISLKFEGSDSQYHSSITHADISSSSFFFSHVIPERGNELIKAGKRFTIEAEADGIRIQFKVMGRLSYQPHKERYRAEFPSVVNYRQRRATYRVGVPASHPIKVRLVADNGVLIGSLVNLSSTGFKAQFPASKQDSLAKNTVFGQSQLLLDDETTLECSLQCHTPSKGSGHTVVCGFSFENIAPMAQRMVDRLVTELQWEEKRHHDD